MIKHLSQRAAVILVVATTALVGGAAVAGATPPTPAEEVESMATAGFAELLPIVLAVGAAAATLAAVFFGVRLVIRGIRSGGRI